MCTRVHLERFLLCHRLEYQQLSTWHILEWYLLHSLRKSSGLLSRLYLEWTVLHSSSVKPMSPRILLEWPHLYIHGQSPCLFQRLHLEYSFTMLYLFSIKPRQLSRWLLEWSSMHFKWRRLGRLQPWLLLEWFQLCYCRKLPLPCLPVGLVLEWYHLYCVEQ